MGIILNLAVPFFGLMFLGYFAARIFDHGKRGLEWLNSFVYYFALPPLIFQTVARADPAQVANPAFVGVTTLATYLVFILVFGAALLVLRASFTEAALRASAGSYGNVGFIGVPLVILALGREAGIAATLILVFDNLVQFTLVPMLTALDSDSEEDWVASTVRALKELALNPMMIAAVLGGLFSFLSLQLPESLETLVEYLARAAAPCALFAIGVIISLAPITRLGKFFPFIVLCKLIVHPLLVLFLLNFIGGFDSGWISAAVIMASLPTAANVQVLAARYDVYEEGAALAILASTVVSVVSVSVFLYMIDQQMLP